MPIGPKDLTVVRRRMGIYLSNDDVSAGSREVHQSRRVRFRFDVVEPGVGTAFKQPGRNIHHHSDTIRGAATFSALEGGGASNDMGRLR